MKADKTRGIDCELIYLPAEAIDRAVIEFIHNLQFDSKMITNAVQSANQSTAGRINELQTDWERVKIKLKDVRTQVSNLVDILAEKGISQLGSVKDKLESLNIEEKDLSEQEQRIAMEINAERAQAGAAHDQIQTLQLFGDFCRLYKGKPDKIKMLLPRFISYVVCHIIDKKKGIGRLDIGLFGRPFNAGQNAEVWNTALAELADACNEATAKAYKSGEVALNKDVPSAAKIHSASVASQAEKACGTEGCGFAAEEQLGSAKFPVTQQFKSHSFAAGEQMGPSKIPATQQFESRIFQYSQPFYSKYQHRRQQFVFGERPKDLESVEAVNQRVWEKHQTYLKRLENFPLKKAEFYRNLQQSAGVKSVRGLSEITGEDWSYIARVLKTLELPESIQSFLKESQEVEIVKHFHLRRLLEVVRLGDEPRQLALFRTMLDENSKLVRINDPNDPKEVGPHVVRS